VEARSSGGFGRDLAGILGIGLAIQLVLAFATYGVSFDIDSFRIVEAELSNDPLRFYDRVSDVNDRYFWPYPPGLLGWLPLAAWLANTTGLPFHGVVQLPAIAATLGIAWLVQHHLGRRGWDERRRLGAAALVMLGTPFVATAGYHGQIDPVAILPALAGLLVWVDSGHPRRALIAGLLIGLGGAIKLPPLIVALGLLPSARSPREGAVLMVSAAAVPLLLLSPFLAADPGGTLEAFGYAGLSGQGGLGMMLQPQLATAWLEISDLDLNAVNSFLLDRSGAVNAALAVAATALLIRARARAVTGAAFLWLVLYVLSPNFALTYLVWGMPFFLLTGRIRLVAALEAALVLPTVILYTAPWESAVVQGVYIGAMAAVWLGCAAAAATIGRTLLRALLRDSGRGEGVVLPPGRAATR
jgi:hypothetical protein